LKVTQIHPPKIDRATATCIKVDGNVVMARGRTMGLSGCMDAAEGGTNEIRGGKHDVLFLCSARQWFTKQERELNRRQRKYGRANARPGSEKG
jgi:hypothetical protein